MSEEQNTTPVVTVEENNSENPSYKSEPKSTVSTDSKNFALMAHLGGIILGFVAPLIVYLVKTDDKFAKDEAKEALNFQITVAIGMLAASILTVVLIGILLFPIILIANLVFSILGAISVSDGKAYKYPVTLRLIK
jgi:uncharacterized protein